MRFIKRAVILLLISCIVAGSVIGAVFGAETDPGIDFAALQKANSDVYAYIKIPGTVINYPIVQHASDTESSWYYLRRGLNKKKSTAGCIMTSPVNAKDFSDPVTVVYGHNMKNGTMFAGLHKYEKAKFMNEHPYVYIYTPEKTYTYRIFAAHHFEDVLLTSHYENFSSEGMFDSYMEAALKEAKSSGVSDSSVNVAYGASKVLTLSTCSWTKPSKRFLVQAVLVSEK